MTIVPLTSQHQPSQKGAAVNHLFPAIPIRQNGGNLHAIYIDQLCTWDKVQNAKATAQNNCK